jgi:hypothetical protein
VMSEFVMKTKQGGKSLRRPRAARAAKGERPPISPWTDSEVSLGQLSSSLASCYHNIHHYYHHYHHLPRTLFVRSTSVFTVISPPFSYLFPRPLSARPFCHPSLSGQ